MSGLHRTADCFLGKKVPENLSLIVGKIQIYNILKTQNNGKRKTCDKHPLQVQHIIHPYGKFLLPMLFQINQLFRKRPKHNFIFRLISFNS